MLKALILAHDYPPLRSAGALRPYGWFLYLKEHGINPAVVTRHWDEGISNAADFVRSSSAGTTTTEILENGTLIRVPHRAGFRDRMILRYGEKRFRYIRKAISFLLSWLKFYFPGMDNTKNIFEEAGKYLQENKTDIILATGEPFILFKYAHQLSRTFGIPYIIDYRDPWTAGLQPGLRERSVTFLRRVFFSHFEKKYFSAAKLVTTASPTYVNKLSRINRNKKIVPILNGYLEMPVITGDLGQEECFTISYSGKIYDFQPLRLVTDAVHRMLEGDPSLNLVLRFIGDREALCRRADRNFTALMDRGVIRVVPPVEYSEYIRLLGRSHVLLLLAKPGIPWLNAKLFDYLAAGRKIWMVLADGGVMEEMLAETRAAVFCRDAGSVDLQLRALLEEFRSAGRVHSEIRHYEQYSRRAQVSGLADLIRSCVE